MKYLTCTLLLFNFFSAVFLQAQSLNFRRDISPFPVYDQNSNLYHYSFLGGFNKPVIQFLDINADGSPDLFLLDQDRPGQLIFFQNSGTVTAPEFHWITDRYQNLSTGAWFKFVDADQDNDFDLYTENPFGNIRYYQNNGTPVEPLLVNRLDSLRDVLNQPIETDDFSIPEWADIDCDNDPDLFLGRLNGRVTLYETVGLNAQNLPQFSFVTDTFQGINIQTGGGELNHEVILNPHGANSLTLVDIDSDLDNDLFWGDFFASSIVHLENYGSCPNPFFLQDSLQEQYPPNQPLFSGGYNVPHFYDIDADGDLDLFVGILGGSLSFTSNIVENFYYYRNTGTASQANFYQETRRFLDAIDVGQNSIPALVDIDQDGDSDLFLANQEDLSSPDASNSRLYFFENQGNPGRPEFRLQVTDYLNYDKRFDVNYAPAFVDIDNDQDFDLIIGKFDGRLSFWQNNGTASIADFVLISENYSGIDIGNNSLPAFTDIDADQDQDLFIGEFNGNINFYRNVGTAVSPNFILDTTHYFGINLGQGELPIPHFHDIDRDNDQDLFIGSATQGVLFYRNAGSAQSADFILDSSFEPEIQLRSSPVLADLDGDGDSDMICGSVGGGTLFYENLEFVSIDPGNSVQVKYPFEISLFPNYPNPFNPNTTISYQMNQPGSVSLRIFDTMGREVRTLYKGQQSAGSYRISWDGRNNAGDSVSSGIYLCQLKSGQTIKSQKLMLIR
ncbi:MAG: VCBS repeat-containing protein [bacterium]|nr:MAG: VCBS repeat-containing protein [bacterium]